MPDLFDNPPFENPLGLDGFEFVEFCAPEKGLLEPVFAAMGFTEIARLKGMSVASSPSSVVSALDAP